MRTVAVHAVLVLACSVSVFGQATSEWRTTHDLPVAVAEVAGGDVEILVAVLPADVSPPDAVAGFPTQVTPRRGALLWTVRVPAMLVQPALSEFAQRLASMGAAAVVALGPVPARQLEGPLAALEGVPVRALPRLPCILAEGGVEVLRGSPERVELELPLPGPADPRYDLLPALAAYVRARLASALPDVRVESELEGGCAHLVVRVPAGRDHPRIVLRTLRQLLAAVPANPPTAEEVARAIASCQSRAARAAVAGRVAAAELAERLALGGGISGALATPAINAATLGELAHQVLDGHAGFATLVEEERRPVSEPPHTLGNGVTLSVRWIPGETGVVAVALGGVDPRVGKSVLTAAAEAAASEGWAASVGDTLGVPTLAVASPAGSVTAVMEHLSDTLSEAGAPTGDDLDTEVARTLGLAQHVTAETVSVALALPPEVEVGVEAADKFFGGLTTGGVRTGTALATPGLAWRAGDGAPQEVGVAELPSTTAGLVAAQVARDRLSTVAGLRTYLLAPPGRVMLAVGGEGGAHVPDLDARLAALWKGACRPVTATEVTAAARHLLALLYGDAAQATARTAAAVFLPVVPTEAELLGTETRQVSSVLASLAVWDKLPRFARGRAPQVVAPPPRKGGVRKSGPER
jgi:hypothetical protein